MKKAFTLLFLLILMITAAACNPGSSEEVHSVTSTPTAGETTAAGETPAAASSATPAAEDQRTQYKLTAVLDYPAKTLSVDESITYTNHSGGVLHELLLVVEPNLEEGVFSISSLSWGDGPRIGDADLFQQTLTIPLAEALSPGENVQIELSYTLDMPSKAGVLCFNEAQVNMSGWYPYVAPYIEGTGWLSHSPGKVGEYQVSELADFQVNIRVDGVSDDFMLAASSRGTYDQGWYRFDQKNARNFTWSGSSNYRMIEAYAGDIRVRAFVFPLDYAAGVASVDATVQALALYSDLFGAYNHDSLTIVEVTFADGMEYDGLHYLGQEYFNTYQGLASSYLIAISVHETAHQWWYGMITNDQAEEPWLDEAFCVYSEELYYENFHPELVSWWWQTRIDYFNPEGWVDSTIYDYRSFRPYVNAVYLRGASFLGDLRQQIGDEAFLEFLQVYFTTIHTQAAKDHLGLATARDFWDILSSVSDQDFSALRAQYFSQQ